MPREPDVGSELGLMFRPSSPMVPAMGVPKKVSVGNQSYGWMDFLAPAGTMWIEILPPASSDTLNSSPRAVNVFPIASNTGLNPFALQDRLSIGMDL